MFSSFRALLRLPSRALGSSPDSDCDASSDSTGSMQDPKTRLVSPASIQKPSLSDAADTHMDRYPSPPPYQIRDPHRDGPRANCSGPERHQESQRSPREAGYRSDGSDWDGDFDALRTSLGISTLDPPAHPHADSPVCVAREAAVTAMYEVLRISKQPWEDYGTAAGGIYISPNRDALRAAARMSQAIRVATSTSHSYVAFLAATTAAEGIAMIGLDFGYGGFILGEPSSQRTLMVLDTAIATAVQAFEDSALSSDNKDIPLGDEKQKL